MGRMHYITWGINSYDKRDLLIVLFSFVLFVVYPLLGALLALYHLASGINRKWNLWIVGLFGAIVGYTYLPYNSMDLTRHYIWFQMYGKASWSEFLLFMQIGGNVDLLSVLVYWLVGKITDNFQIIGAISGFTFYFFSISAIDIWSDSWKLENKRFWYLVAVGSFLALTSVYLFSAIRNGNAVAIFIYLWMSQLKCYQSKRQWLFVIPCLLHFSMFPIVLLYFISSNCSWKVIRRITIGMLIVSLLFKPFLLSLADIFQLLGSFGVSLSDKIHGYIEGENNNKVENLFLGSVVRYIVTWFLLIGVVIGCLLMKKEKIIKKDESLFRFYAFLVLFLGYFFMTVATYIHSRNIYILVYLIVFYLTLVSTNRKTAFRLKSNLKLLMIMVCFSGVLSYYIGREYRVVNPVVWKPNIANILSVKTNIVGYEM